MDVIKKVVIMCRIPYQYPCTVRTVKGLPLSTCCTRPDVQCDSINMGIYVMIPRVVRPLWISQFLWILHKHEYKNLALHWHEYKNLALHWHEYKNLALHWHEFKNLTLHWHEYKNLALHWHEYKNLALHWHEYKNLALHWHEYKNLSLRWHE